MAAGRRQGAPALDRRALNRALLARQHLLERARMPAREMVRHLVGLQSQVPRDPYQALWSRIVDFDPMELARLMTDREVARASLMRRTIHTATASDCLVLRPFVQRIYDVEFARGPWSVGIAGVAPDRLAIASRPFVEERPRTAKELREFLAPLWPANDPTSLAHAVHDVLQMVQVTPRGVWGQSLQPTWTTVEAWLGAPVASEAPAEEIVLRYLAAFGPASAMDVQAWAGVTRLAPVLAALRPRLATFRAQDGRELFDLPDAPRPDPETPAPVRFLPQYDNVLLGHADRTRMVADEVRRELIARNPDGYAYGTILVDGRVACRWRIEAGPEVARLVVHPIDALHPDDADAIVAEGGCFLRFNEPAAVTSRVDVLDPWRG